MSKPEPYPKIGWPKGKSATQLRAMTTKQAFRYALRLHEAWAEENRRSMEWDLCWVEFYKKCLKELKP